MNQTCLCRYHQIDGSYVHYFRTHSSLRTKKDQKSVLLTTDQHHIIASRAQVTSHQCDVFFTFSADKLLSFNGLHTQLEKDFFAMIIYNLIVWSKL